MCLSVSTFAPQTTFVVNQLIQLRSNPLLEMLCLTRWWKAFILAFLLGISLFFLSRTHLLRDLYWLYSTHRVTKRAHTIESIAQYLTGSRLRTTPHHQPTLAVPVCFRRRRRRRAEARDRGRRRKAPKFLCLGQWWSDLQNCLLEMLTCFCQIQKKSHKTNENIQ